MINYTEDIAFKLVELTNKWCMRSADKLLIMAAIDHMRNLERKPAVIKHEPNPSRETIEMAIEIAAGHLAELRARELPQEQSYEPVRDDRADTGTPAQIELRSADDRPEGGPQSLADQDAGRRDGAVAGGADGLPDVRQAL